MLFPSSLTSVLLNEGKSYQRKTMHVATHGKALSAFCPASSDTVRLLDVLLDIFVYKVKRSVKSLSCQNRVGI